MQMLGGRQDASGGTAPFKPQQQKPQQASAPAQSSQFDAPPVDDGFDDIPF